MKFRTYCLDSLLIVILLLGGCAQGTTAGGCGDGICQEGESCPEDCSQLCGNGTIDGDEECDGTAFGANTCESQGFFGGTLGCNSDCTLNTTNCESVCNDQCADISESRCSGNQVQQCMETANGCFFWENTTDCVLTSQVCDDTSGSALCSDSCSDACTQGTKRCSGNYLQSCQLGENGCTQWKDERDCAESNFECMAFEATFTCVDPCTHECELTTPDRCSVDTTQTCVTDVDGCRVWQNVEDCSTTGRVCNTGSCVCVNACADASTRCSADLRQLCVADAYGCYDWDTQENCATGGMVCDSSSGTAQCVLSCTNACSSGQTDCLGDVTRTCVMQGSGCYGWNEVENCATTLRSCSTGTCVCNDQCSSSQTRCVGDMTQSCSADAYGCYHFYDDTDCAALSQTCVSGTCQAPTGDFICSATSGYSTIASTGTNLTTDTYMDDGRYAFTIPFAFNYYGTNYTTGYLCTNGWASFGADPGTNNLSNTALPNGTTPNAAIYVFWDDLVYSQSTWPDSRLLYQTIGTSPNRVFVLEWYEVRYIATGTDHSASFQLRLYETTNAFEVSYDRANWLGSSWSATIGYEDGSGTLGGDIGTTFSAPPVDDYHCVPN
ncbi:hypothetical protein KKF84_04425 [Myxococcota bacterium]|nr:hypothetical protein [Myxococcota bacterium]MBU1534541.1 hypothetical protein [Myxococcota bacterium]